MYARIKIILSFQSKLKAKIRENYLNNKYQKGLRAKEIKVSYEQILIEWLKRFEKCFSLGDVIKIVWDLNLKLKDEAGSRLSR